MTWTANYASRDWNKEVVMYLITSLAATSAVKNVTRGSLLKMR